MVTKDHGTPVFPKEMSAIKRTENEWLSAISACKLKLWHVTELQVWSLLPHCFQKQEFDRDGGDGCGGGRRRWMGWRTEAGVGMGCSSTDGV